MTGPTLPLGEGDVPDKILEELLAAFAGDKAGLSQAVDFDDPSIDRLLGIEPGAGTDVPTDVIPAQPPPPASSAAASTQPELTEPELKQQGLNEPKATEERSTDLATAPVAVVAADQPAPTRQPIKIGGDHDDLVDAVYLDEEGADRLRGDSDRSTEASVARTTIRIGDDEIEGSSGGIPVATGASMDPRLRARRIAVRRAMGRKRLRWFVVGGVVILLGTAVLALLGSSLFEVDHVDRSGVSGNTLAAFEAAEAELLGHPVLLVNTNSIESRLEKHPWIGEARVSTDFPNGASIEIVERVPLATYMGIDNRWRLIDVEGAVLKVFDGQPVGFMLITGPGGAAEAGGFAGDAFRHAAELVDALTPGVTSRTQQVVVSETGELSLRFATTEVILGAPENLLDKLTRLEAVLTDSESANLVVINVTTRDVSVQ